MHSSFNSGAFKVLAYDMYFLRKSLLTILYLLLP
jgi:hypothetical protein